MSWQKPRPRPEAGPLGRGLKAWLVPLFSAPRRAQPGLWIHRRRVHRWTDGGAAQHRAPGEYGTLSVHAALPPGRSSSLDPWLHLSGPPTPSLVPRDLPGSAPTTTTRSGKTGPLSLAPPHLQSHTATHALTLPLAEVTASSAEAQATTPTPSPECLTQGLCTLSPPTSLCMLVLSHTPACRSGIPQTRKCVVLCTCASNTHNKFGRTPAVVACLASSTVSHTSPTQA